MKLENQPKFQQIPTGKLPKEILDDFFCPYCYSRNYQTRVNSSGIFHICDKCFGIRVWEVGSEYIEFSYPKYVL